MLRSLICQFRVALISFALVTPATAQTIKIATLAPDGSGWMTELRAAAAEVKQGTAGRVRVKFYPGGVMGNDAVVLRKIRLGQLQGGVLTSSELSLIYADATAYSLPFLFRDWGEVERARAEVDPLLGKGFEQVGLKMLAVSGVGFAYMMSSKPLRTHADIQSIKLWLPQNDRIAERTFKAAGISPIPLPLGDVFTSLQTGLVDTVANTSSGAVALQWHGKLKHLVDLPLTFVTGYMVMDWKAWSRLAPADQAVVGKAFATAAARMDATVKLDDAAALAAMKKQGLTVAALDPAEEARWRQAGARVTREMEAEKSISPAVMAALRRVVPAGRP